MNNCGNRFTIWIYRRKMGTQSCRDAHWASVDFARNPADGQWPSLQASVPNFAAKSEFTAFPLDNFVFCAILSVVTKKGSYYDRVRVIRL